MSKVTVYWSSTGGVGKTTLAIAKAITLAEEKEKVVLVDFNEVTPHVHRLLKLKSMNFNEIYNAIEQRNISSN